MFREYPVAPERSGRPEDYTSYPTWLANLRSAFTAAGHNYGLSITLPSSFWYLQNFDIVKLEPVVDWFNMMGKHKDQSSWLTYSEIYADLSLPSEYDIHGVWDATDVWTGRKDNPPPPPPPLCCAREL